MAIVNSSKCGSLLEDSDCLISLAGMELCIMKRRPPPLSLPLSFWMME